MIKCTKALAAILFFYGECVNLTILQEQSQLFSNFFKRAIVDICTFKGDFRNGYFLQRAALSEYLV